MEERNKISLEELSEKIESLRMIVNDLQTWSIKAAKENYATENRLNNIRKELTDNIEFSQKNIAKLWSFVGDICFFLSSENKKFDPFMYNLRLKLGGGKEHPRYTEDRFVSFF